MLGVWKNEDLDSIDLSLIGEGLSSVVGHEFVCYQSMWLNDLLQNPSSDVI
jgi:hypothetical protein